MNLKLRHRINPEHPGIVADGKYRMLTDSDVLEKDDQTICVSVLMNMEHPGRWDVVWPEWEPDIGKMIAEVLGPDSPDCDKDERIFRRLIIN